MDADAHWINPSLLVVNNPFFIPEKGHRITVEDVVYKVKRLVVDYEKREIVVAVVRV